jgi:hypothetical protein
MTANSVLEPEVEPKVEKKTVNLSGPKPATPLRPKRRTLLEEIFEGHEEYLGYTPD